ncbi:MarR family transcriptional regulator [Schumannella luteola]|uniref:DNA-binding MarR family transcriptional regulator n=1 Tax=Schumannella luteola TaxID=472059 RepID=A0A852YE61_9MICO|nr:MarR family transcriptional regulator [Schumannella luteola]NYH00063.1 DNA-binding MarR family transcriptional regulator [Schumannella luteola]TPX06619.1 MarR family transcriptional regulator [Schumannella luteola]
MSTITTGFPVGDDIEVAHALALAVGRVNRRMQRAGGSLNHAHLSAMATLVRDGPLRLGELAGREQVSAPSMTRTVTELESRQLVQRRPDIRDGRSVIVEITEHGSSTVQRARSERAGILADLLDRLDADQRRALTGALPALQRLAEI